MNMLKPTTVFLHTGHMKRLRTLALAQGTTASALTRLAIFEYLRREEPKAAK
jgi:hypothetical protein